jgi:hypothetical protein
MMTILKMTYFYMSFLRILFYIFYGFCFTIYSKKIMRYTFLRRSDSGGYRHSCRSLRKVTRHVLLQVEVSQLLTLLYLEQRLQLGIGIDLTTILLVLKAVGANVGIDLTSHLGPGKLSANGPSKKLGELLRNECGLDKTGRSAVTSLALTLGSLLGGTHLTSNIALESAEVTAKRRQAGTKGVEFGAKLRKERAERSLNGGDTISMSITSGCGSRNYRSRSCYSIRLRTLRSLGSLIGLRCCYRSRNGNGSRS